MSNEYKREILRKYLASYRIARLRLEKLKTRHDALVSDMETSLKGSTYASMPRSGQVSEGAASIVYKISDIETRIEGECKTMFEQCMKVMDILDFLENDSDQRLILELRYIDAMSWYDIADSMCWSKSSCCRIERQALDYLLTFDRVKEIVGLEKRSA